MHILASFTPLLFIVSRLGTRHQQIDTQRSSKEPSDEIAASLSILLALKRQLGLTRRFFRAFRFLDAFNSAYNLFQAKDMTSMSIVMVLDIMARTFNGMYLLLETATLVDAMGVEGLAVWSPEYESFLKIESQRSWFLALVCGGVSCGVVLYKDQTERASLTTLLQEKQVKGNENSEKEESSSSGSDSKESSSKQTHISRRMAELDRRRVALARKLTANCLDLALPGAVIGWVPASSGTVGLCMFTTSLLTGWDVWERCGREVRGA